jgi:hypothetical protein
MAKEVICPTCSADLPLGGDELNGDEIYCTVCGATSVLEGNYGGDELDVEDDI